MPHEEPDSRAELRQAAIRLTRSSLELTEALIRLLDGDEDEKQERPGHRRLRALHGGRTAS